VFRSEHLAIWLVGKTRAQKMVVLEDVFVCHLAKNIEHLLLRLDVADLLRRKKPGFTFPIVGYSSM
jgi:hypothetical protein